MSQSAAFYGGLFGWETVDAGAEMGHYTTALVDGRPVAGIGPSMQPGVVAWTNYINVTDIAAITAKVADAGGTTVAGPMEVPGQGHMAVYLDTTGAAVAAWQPTGHQGAQLVNEPGAWCWSELSTSDLEASKAFYGSVFGWSFGGTPDYAEAQVGGRSIAGIMPRPATMGAEIPDAWLTYFSVADLEAGAQRAVDLGASVMAGPMSAGEQGRFTVLTDPHGGVFALFQS